MGTIKRYRGLSPVRALTYCHVDIDTFGWEFDIVHVNTELRADQHEEARAWAAGILASKGKRVVAWHEGTGGMDEPYWQPELATATPTA